MSIMLRLSIENYKFEEKEPWYWSEFFDGKTKEEALYKIKNYLKQQRIKPYIGLDDVIYPKFIIEEIIVR